MRIVVNQNIKQTNYSEPNLSLRLFHVPGKWDAVADEVPIYCYKQELQHQERLFPPKEKVRHVLCRWN